MKTPPSEKDLRIVIAHPTRSILTFCSLMAATCWIVHNQFVVDSNLKSSDTESASIHLVQEPAGRSSFRPSFPSVRKPDRQDRMTHSMRQVFKEALGDSWKSTVRFLHSEEQIALGAIVDSDGWIVTKSSQLPASGEMVCRLFDGREVPAKVSSKVIDLDIALVKVEAKNLIPVSWVSQVTPQRGKWLATTDGRSLPLKVGVISAGIQSVKSEFPKLGISFNDNARITMVLPGSGAYEAGLKVDDVIYSINGQVFDSGEKGVTSRLQNAIKTGGRAGEYIRIGIARGERRFDVEARLMDLTYELLDETEMEVNGRVSARATGFSSVFMHDTVLEPNECGGPLVNLDGQVMGINIARASRVTSYALPASAVRPTIENMISQAKLVSRPAIETSNSTQPIR